MATSSSERKRRRRRRRGKSRGAGVVLTFLAVILIIGAIIAAVTVFFKIRTVNLEGQTAYPKNGIVDASQIEAGKNMFLFNKFAAISRIFAQYPYLDEISIRRKLPDVVEIIVTECTPVAVLHSMSSWEIKPAKGDEPAEIRTADEYYIIDIKGKLLEKIAYEQAAGQRVVEGVDLLAPEVGKYAVFADNQKEKPLFLVLNSAIDNDILLNIGAVDLSETYSISFKYMDRFTVKIGTTEDLDKKIRFAQLVIRDKLGPQDRGTIDVTDVQTVIFRAD